jgi:LPS sulfotransferase NodH
MGALSEPERWHPFVPAHFDNPSGLAWRLLKRGDRDAYAAMAQAALGLASAPLDRRMEPAEAARYARAEPPTLPMLFVAGPPRSGTTLLTQTVVATLPVGYFTNLTTLFPRAPLEAMARLGPRLPPWRPRFRSFYGRMRGLAAPSDALALWDRWLGADRTVPRSVLPDRAREALVRFFGAAEALFQRPLVNKNNALDAQAALVGEALPTARFLILSRERVPLALALLKARQVIHNDLMRPYGLAEPGTERLDPVTSVCRQVLWHEQLAQQQQARIGADRVSRVAYEDFCRDPAAILGVVAERLGVPVRPERLAALPTFRPSRGAPEPRLREEIAGRFAWLGASPS